MKEKQNTWRFKLSLLSISTLLMSAPIISAALPLMFDDFPNQSQAAVETLLTVPNFGIIIALLISPIFIRFLGKKKTIQLGLMIALASGLLPVFISDYFLILASRFTFGAGIGLFNSLAVSLIAEFYQGEELSTMMGYQSVAGALGSAALAFIVSYLVTLGWQQTFLAYLIIVPVLVLFTLFIPIEKTVTQEAVAEKNTAKFSFSLPVMWLSLLIFFLFTFYMASVIKLPEFIVSNDLGTVSSVSNVTGFTTLVGIPVGLLYGKIRQQLHDWTLAVGLLIVAVGFLLSAWSTSLALLVIGIVLTRCGFALSIPSIYIWTSQVAKKETINLAYTSLIIATNIGVFCSPVLLNTLGILFSNASAGFSFILAAIGFLLITLIIFLQQLRTNKQAITESNE